MCIYLCILGTVVSDASPLTPLFFYSFLTAQQRHIGTNISAARQHAESLRDQCKTRHHDNNRDDCHSYIRYFFDNWRASVNNPYVCESTYQSIHVYGSEVIYIHV